MDTRIRRSERLKSKQAIDRLFKKGERVGAGGFLLLYHLERGNGRIRFTTSVPKKKIKKAKDRNRSKRIIRELFRNEKERISELLRKNDANADLFFLYRKNEVPSYQDAEKEMIRLLERWEKEIPDKIP